MRSSKLFAILEQLQPAELDAFGDYLASPIFNTKAPPRELLALMRKHLLEKPEGNLTEEETHHLLFPDKPFKINYIRKLKTHVLDHLDNFLALQTWQREPLTQRQHLLKRLNRFPDPAPFESHFRKAEKELDKAHYPDRNSYDQAFHLRDQIARYFNKQARRESNPHLALALENLEHDYVLQRLRLGFLLLNQQITTGQSPEQTHLPALMAELQERLESFPPLLQLYWHLVRCMQEPENQAHYLATRNHLDALAPGLAQDEGSELYAGLLNRTIRMLNQGQDHARDLYQLYRKMLAGGYLYDNDQLPYAHFKNIVSAGLRVSAFEETETFIEEYAPRIPEAQQKVTREYTLGELAFRKGDYAIAARHFHTVLADFEDIFFGMDARQYLLRIAYETGDVIGMDSLCSAFRMYLDRNKQLSKSRKASLQAFIRFYRRFIKIPGKNKKRLAKLYEDIQAEPLISKSNWLVKKVEELLEAA